MKIIKPLILSVIILLLVKTYGFCQILPVKVTDEYACFDSVAIKQVRKYLEELAYLRKKDKLYTEKIIVLESTISSYEEIDLKRQLQDNMRVSMLKVQEKQINNLEKNIKRKRLENKILKITNTSTIFICILIVFL